MTCTAWQPFSGLPHAGDGFAQKFEFEPVILGCGEVFLCREQRRRRLFEGLPVLLVKSGVRKLLPQVGDVLF